MTVMSTPILGTVTPGREHYCPILAEQLHRMWPGHPPLYYALPAGRTAPYENIIPTDAVTWSTVLLRGLEHLRDRLNATHVFMLLEDHVPLWPCDGEFLAEMIDLAVAEDLPCVFFVKYRWPWHDTSHRLDSQGRVTGWRQIDVVTLRGHRLARVPADYFRYNQCQPAIWKLDYYVDLVREAVSLGIETPWQFEAYSRPNQPQHYVSEYRWPSRMSGFRREGRIYLRALYPMKMPEGRELLEELLKEAFPRLSPACRRLVGEAFLFWGRLRGGASEFERRHARAVRR
jgi:hypothetical protein